MTPPPLPLRRSSAEWLRAVALRTTVRGDGPPAEVTAEHLRVIVARVLRTGRGPAALLGWVRQELTDGRPTDEVVGRLALLLADRLVSAGGQTVGG